MIIFQLTTSRRGRPPKQKAFADEYIFQLTTSRRGRPRWFCEKSETLSFQLTTSRRGRQKQNSRGQFSSSFQLTTSRRGRQPDEPTLFGEEYFNSLPHAEVDGVMMIQDCSLWFQLTTSRRGRQQFVTKSMDINHRFHNKSHNKSLFFALIILCLSIFH